MCPFPQPAARAHRGPAYPGRPAVRPVPDRRAGDQQQRGERGHGGRHRTHRDDRDHRRLPGAVGDAHPWRHPGKVRAGPASGQRRRRARAVPAGPGARARCRGGNLAPARLPGPHLLVALRTGQAARGRVRRHVRDPAAAARGAERGRASRGEPGTGTVGSEPGDVGADRPDGRDGSPVPGPAAGTHPRGAGRAGRAHRGRGPGPGEPAAAAGYAADCLYERRARRTAHQGACQARPGARSLLGPARSGPARRRGERGDRRGPGGRGDRRRAGHGPGNRMERASPGINGSAGWSSKGRGSPGPRAAHPGRGRVRSAGLSIGPFQGVSPRKGMSAATPPGSGHRPEPGRTGPAETGPAETGPTAPVRRRHWGRTTLVVLGVGVITTVLILDRHLLAQSLAALGSLDPRWFGLAIACEAVSLVAFGLSRRRLLSADGQRARFSSVMAITYAGNALSMSIPFAGAQLAAVFSYQQFRRRGLQPAITGWALGVSAIVSSSALALVLVVGAFAGGAPLATAAGFLGAAVFALPAITVFLALRYPRARDVANRVLAWAVGLVRRIIHKPGLDPAVLDGFLQQLAGIRLRWPG